MASNREIDEIAGVETTGHEWDGIKELNTPLPRWWLYVFYATCIWALGYWIVMPAWPLLNSYTKGVIDYSQRAKVAADIAAAQEAQKVYRDQIAASPVSEIPSNQEVHEFALAGGRAAFGDNCAPCHGSGAQGFVGYPNLNDDSWLWGGTLDDIYITLAFGIRSGHEESRENDMPAFLKDGILERDQIDDIAEFVLALSGTGTDADAAGRGEEPYAENCAACHGEDGTGIQELGAPNLTDAIWLYGGDKEAVVASISNSRRGVMPYWTGRLDDVTIKQLTLYVHSLGGGQ